MIGTKGTVVAVNGNLVSVRFDGAVSMNEVGYVNTSGSKLKGEVIRIRGDVSQLQVFEITRGIMIGDEVEYSGDLLAVELGPGLLGQVFDGLQNPLPKLAEEAGFFLERGIYMDPLPQEREWVFTPSVKVGDKLERGDTLGTVPENSFVHKIMVPFNFYGAYTVVSIKGSGSYKLKDTIAELKDEKGNTVPVSLSFRWPVKRPIDCYEERLKPKDPMVTLLHTRPFWRRKNRATANNQPSCGC